jgi:hypothetical protein
VGEKWSRRWFIHRSSLVTYLAPPASGSATTTRARRKAKSRETKRARDDLIVSDRYIIVSDRVAEKPSFSGAGPVMGPC